MEARRVLLIGPFPPPIGGDTVLTLNVSRSRHWRERGVEIERIDTSPGGRIRVPDEKLTAADLLRGARAFFEFTVRMPRCGAVMLWANSRFLVTEGLAIIVWSRLWGKPVFVKMFGAYLAARIRGIPRPWRGFVVRVIGMTDCVFAETRGLARDLVGEGWFAEDRVVVLPNFLASGSPAPPRAPKSFSGKCVFFGHIKREKGVFDIVEALGDEANTSCDFYGPLLERDREEFLAAIAARENLSYRGTVEPGLVSLVAAGYDALLLPTYHPSEGYPAVIIEAYAAGIPVIATDWLALPEIVEDGVRGILVPVRSPAKIRMAVRRLAADDSLYASMCASALAFAANFSEQAVIGGILVPRVTGRVRPCA